MSIETFFPKTLSCRHCEVASTEAISLIKLMGLLQDSVLRNDKQPFSLTNISISDKLTQIYPVGMACFRFCMLGQFPMSIPAGFEGGVDVKCKSNIYKWASVRGRSIFRPCHCYGWGP